MKYTITITCEPNPQSHPNTMLQHATLGFHPTYVTPRQTALRAYDEAAYYREELTHLQNAFGLAPIPTHLMRAGW